MTPDDPRHGTTRGYRAGCNEPCCREAQNAYERRRRKHHQVFGTTLQVDATGTRRRIQALMALGHTSRTIAIACGWTTGEAVLEVTRRNWVQVKTAETVAAAFEALSMSVGTSTQTRRHAERQGWPPPLAWDDIDNDADPRDWAYRAPTRAELLDDLDEQEAGISEVCRVLDVTRDALEAWCRRHDYSGLFSRLVAREDVGQVYRNQWTKEAS